MSNKSKLGTFVSSIALAFAQTYKRAKFALFSRIRKRKTSNLSDMTNKKVTDYLEYYKSLSNPQYAVLLNGSWGCGKTFYIKNQIDTWDTKEKVDEEEISIKPIYVSLNGLSKTSQINEKIKSTLNPLLYSKSAKFIKGLLLGAVKATTQISLDANKDGESDGNISFNIDSLGLLKSSDAKIKGNKILIFDDLERCNIELNEVFGYINDFVEHSECKVVILADEKRLKEKIKEPTVNFNYKNIKEKLIGQVFTIKPDVENALSFFINQLKNKELKSLLNTNYTLIIDIFAASKTENLRIVRQAILGFERFISQIDKRFVKHKNFFEFVKHLLAYFLLVYFEHKNGNENIKLLQQIPFDKSEKEIYNNLQAKYNEPLTKHSIILSSYVISIDSIIYFIENGFIDTLTVNQDLSGNHFYREDTVQPWEKLWYWAHLEDDEFDKLYPVLWENFTEQKYEVPFIILHVVGILIDLNVGGIVENDLEEIVAVAKAGIDKVFMKENLKFGYFKFDHYLSKGYLSKNHEKFIEVRDYIHEKIKNYSLDNKDDYLKLIFENLSDDIVPELYDKLRAPLPDSSRIYESTAIFENINGTKMAECFLKMTNENQDNFMYFLKNRYEPENVYLDKEYLEYHSRDIKCLIEFKSHLESQVGNRKKISKFLVGSYIKALEKLIDKLKSFENIDK